MHDNTHCRLHCRSFSGWALTRACELDAVTPGVVVQIIRSRSSLARQAAFAALAVFKGERSELARTILQGDPRKTLDLAFGSRVAGLKGVLARVGGSPLRSAAIYTDLHALFALRDPRARALMQISGPISFQLIDVALCLDPAIATPSIFARLRGAGDAARLDACLSVVRATCSNVDDVRIRESLKATPRELDVAEWTKRFLLRNMDRLPDRAPIASDDETFQLLESGRALQATARRFQNCLATKVPQVATGRAVYMVARHRDIVVELRRLSCPPHFLVVEARKPKNEGLSPDDHAWLAAQMSARGLPMLAPAREELAFDAMREFDLGYFDPIVPIAA